MVIVLRPGAPSMRGFRLLALDERQAGGVAAVEVQKIEDGRGGPVHFTRGDQVVGTIEAPRKKTVVLSGLKFVLALPCNEC
jgi:hypothetical protein